LSTSGAASPSSSKIAVDLPLEAGQILEGKFRVEKIIGEGAMGLVVEATHLALDERVALKFLRREARDKPDIVVRFAREARAAAKIKSDHVARVYDVGTAPDGSPFIVMEFLEGNDLEHAIQARGKLPTLEAVEHVIEACEGLAAAHALGVIHRDIKPGNLFLSSHGGRQQIKVLDFGISKAGISGTFEDIDLALAQTTQIMGSPHYMSPEQIRSTKDVDPRADVWSLGVVLFELVTGETPFVAADVTGIIAQVLYEEPRSIKTFLPDVPAGLEDVISRCLAKDPAKRFASAAELAVALLPFAPKRARALVERASAVSTRTPGKSEPADSYPPPPKSGATTKPSIVAPDTASAAVTPPPPQKRKPVVAWVAGACIVLGTIGAFFTFVGRSHPPATPDTNAAVVTQPTAVATAKAEPTATVATPTPVDAAFAGEATSAETSKAGTATARPAAAPTPKAARPTARPAGSNGRTHAESSESEIRLER
jgi:serine/threonine-protein kinase